MERKPAQKGNRGSGNTAQTGPRSAGPGAGGREEAGTFDALLDQALGEDKPDLGRLAWLGRRMLDEQWSDKTGACERLAARLLDVGEPLVAHDVLAKGLEYAPGNVRMRQLLALALARSGATRRANGIAETLYGEGHGDGETLGILARTHKDLSEHATDPRERLQELARAHMIYAEAYTSAIADGRLDDAIYTGTNAAATGSLLGEKDRPREIAAGVRKLCFDRLRKGDDYWAIASLGEAAIILGDLEEARAWYERATALSRGNFGNLSSTRRNARLLAEHLCAERALFDHCFGVPEILAFTGLLTRGPDEFRFCYAVSEEDRLREALARKLQQYPNKIGYCGATSALDIVFAEQMLKQDSECNLVLPCELERFEAVCVAPNAEPKWLERFRYVVEHARRITVAGDDLTPVDSVGAEYTNLMQVGVAKLRAEMLDTKLVPIAVQHGGGGRATAADALFVCRWRALGIEPQIVDVSHALSGEGAGTAASVATTERANVAGTTAQELHFPRRIAAIFVADVRGYSQLTEDQIQHFVLHFVGAVGDMIKALPNPPVEKNRWGDALIFIFASVGDAGRFALDLVDRMTNARWDEMGLPDNLRVRVALHAGPVYCCTDAVTGLPTFTGVHVTRAARIEPIAPPGQVYASEAFAALSAASPGDSGFACDYVGQTPLAKGFGTFPTYHVRRA